MCFHPFPAVGAVRRRAHALELLLDRARCVPERSNRRPDPADARLTAGDRDGVGQQRPQLLDPGHRARVELSYAFGFSPSPIFFVCVQFSVTALDS